MIVNGQNGGSLDGLDDRLPKTPVSAFMTPSKYDHEDEDEEENDEAMLGRVYFVKTKLAGRRYSARGRGGRVRPRANCEAISHLA